MPIPTRMTTTRLVHNMDKSHMNDLVPHNEDRQLLLHRNLDSVDDLVSLDELIHMFETPADCGNDLQDRPPQIPWVRFFLRARYMCKFPWVYVHGYVRGYVNGYVQRYVWKTGAAKK